jgi:hypothetical protein
MAAAAFFSFFSAFLLFQVQPLMGRFLLPWFGGTAAVWCVCLLFYQCALLAGYGYAHSTSRMGMRRRSRVHAALLMLSVTTLGAQWLVWGTPMAPDSSWKPAASEEPILRLLMLLTLCVGLPFGVLASTTPLIQARFHANHAERSPYPLYAWSNAGSILGLLSYPSVVEPWFSLREQAWIWSAAYLAWAILLLLDLMMPRRQAAARRGLPEDPLEQVTRMLRLRWLALAACGSTLLLAGTQHLCEVLSPVPLLWVIPLGLYLFSFIAAFRLNARAATVGRINAYLVSALLFAATLLGGTFSPALLRGGACCSVIFLGCWLCHGELYRVRPRPSRLTLFYLWAAAGGALGGVLVNLLAPHVLPGYWEFPFSMAACCLIVLPRLLAIQRSQQGFSLPSSIALLLSGIAVVVFLPLAFLEGGYGRPEIRLSIRNFYGVLRVLEVEAKDRDRHAYILQHGGIRHGYQFAATERKREPTGYHSSRTGAGQLFSQIRESSDYSSKGLSVGVVGLGAGVLAAYGRAGDTFRFYEINPEVIRFAQGEGGFFSFLKDTPASVDIVTGDARLSLESELEEKGSQGFDVLVVDVFSGWFVPVHLVTREAFELFSAHLAPGGVIAMDITNRHIDFVPLVRGLAEIHGLEWRILETPQDGEGSWRSVWALLWRPGQAPSIPILTPSGAEYRASPSQVWTDDHASVWNVHRLFPD